MSPRLRLFARLTGANFRRHRARWALTTFGIAVGVTSFTGVAGTSRSVMHSFEQSVTRTAGRAQLQVNNGTAGVDADLLREIRRLPEVETVSGNVEYGLAVPALRRRLTIFGIELGEDDAYRREQFGPAVLEVPDTLVFLSRPDSIAVAQEVLDEQGWTLGSTFEVKGPKGIRQLTVRGIVHPSGALGVFGGSVAVMDADAAQLAFGERNRFHWIDVVVRPDAPIAAVRDTLVRLVAGRGTVDTPLGRGRRMEAMLTTLRTMLTDSGLIAMLVGIFLIYHTVATAVSQREAELQTLWALGAPRRHLAGYLLAEATLVGLVGSLLGIAAGVGFTFLAASSFGTVIGATYAPIPTTSVAFTPTELAIALASGLGAILAGAGIPCTRALRLGGGAPARFAASPRRLQGLLAVAGLAAIGLSLTAARGASAPAFGARVTAVAASGGLVFVGLTLLAPAFVSVATPILGRLLRGAWGLLGTWTWVQVRKRPAHTATTMGSLAAGVAFALCMTTLLGSYRQEFVRWMNRTFEADVFVNAGSQLSLLGGPTVDAGLQHELESLPGVRRVFPWRLIEVQFRGQPIIVQGMAESLIDRAQPGVTLDHDRGEVVVSDTLAERYALRVGDPLTLPAPFGPLRLTIGAIAPDYTIDLGNVKIGWRTLVRYFGESDANVLLVDAREGVSGRELKRAIEEQIGGRYDVTVLTHGELRQLVGDLLDQSFALTHWLEGLAVLVTICAMINATSAAIIDRAEHLTTLRALGMLRGRLVALLVLEAGLVGALGSVLGLAGGSLLGATLVNTVARRVAGFRLAVHWPVAAMTALVVLSAASAAGAAYFVARRWTARTAELAGEARLAA